MQVTQPHVPNVKEPLVLLRCWIHLGQVRGQMLALSQSHGCLEPHPGLCRAPFYAKQAATLPCVTAQRRVGDMAALAQSVLVTGSNRGIGLELVRQLAASPRPPQHIFATCRDPKGPRGKVSVGTGDGMRLSQVCSRDLQFPQPWWLAALAG